MKATFFSTALFLGLLLSMPAPMEGAALSNGSLQGTYFFVLQRIDTQIIFGFRFTTAQGFMTFDQNGKIAVSGAINRDGTVQTLNSSGTYSLSAAGNVQVALPDPSISVRGKVAFDLTSIVATNVTDANPFTQEIFIATKQSPSPFVSGVVNGRYFLSERTVTAGSGMPLFESASGTITLDGKASVGTQGGCTFDLLSNRNGSIVPVSGTGTYAIGPDGSVSLSLPGSLPGRNSAVKFGFTADGNIGVGATVVLQSNATHDVFSLVRAASDGLGNASLNGSYEIVTSSWNNPNFSTSEASADYFGDGTVSYRPVQTGTPAAGNVTIATDGSLQFTGLPNAAGSFRGGVGFSGHSFVAAAVGDASAHRFLMAIRTPSQVTSVANAASFSSSAAMSPGALISIFGRNLARRTALFSTVPLPRSLAGTTVKIGGVEAPLLFVSPYQLNLQVPYEVQPGQSNITVVLDGFESGPLAVTVNNSGPGIFTLTSDGRGAGIFLHGADFSLVTRTNPARPGEVVLIYGTGLGAVLPSVKSGELAPGDPPASATASVSVTINGIDAGTPLFAGLAPGFVGLYQVNVPIPAAITTAGDVPVVITAAGVPGNSVTLPVAP